MIQFNKIVLATALLTSLSLSSVGVCWSEETSQKTAPVEQSKEALSVDRAQEIINNWYNSFYASYLEQEAYKASIESNKTSNKESIQKQETPATLYNVYLLLQRSNHSVKPDQLIQSLPLSEIERSNLNQEFVALNNADAGRGTPPTATTDNIANLTTTPLNPALNPHLNGTLNDKPATALPTGGAGTGGIIGGDKNNPLAGTGIGNGIGGSKGGLGSYGNIDTGKGSGPFGSGANGNPLTGGSSGFGNIGNGAGGASGALGSYGNLGGLGDKGSGPLGTGSGGISIPSAGGTGALGSYGTNSGLGKGNASSGFGPGRDGVSKNDIVNGGRGSAALDDGKSGPSVGGVFNALGNIIYGAASWAWSATAPGAAANGATALGTLLAPQGWSPHDTHGTAGQDHGNGGAGRPVQDYTYDVNRNNPPANTGNGNGTGGSSTGTTATSGTTPAPATATPAPATGGTATATPVNSNGTSVGGGTDPNPNRNTHTASAGGGADPLPGNASTAPVVGGRGGNTSSSGGGADPLPSNTSSLGTPGSRGVNTSSSGGGADPLPGNTATMVPSNGSGITGGKSGATIWDTQNNNGGVVNGGNFFQNLMNTSNTKQNQTK